MESRSATPIARPLADVPVRERATLRGRIHRVFGELANRVSLIVGSPWAFLLAALTIVAWGVSGPAFHYSDSWQLVINTGTTIVTFLMVFLIQHTQNKDALAIQLKLNELIAAVKGASGRLINIEKMSDEELDRLHAQFQTLADEMRVRGDVAASHSVEEERAGEPTGAAGAAREAGRSRGGSPSPSE
jgi:low affinity Fe/Cu permease